MERELEHALAAADDGAQEEHRGRLAQRLDDVRRLRTFALPLLDDLAALPAQATWGEWARALSALSTRALRDPTRVLQTLAELGPLADVGPVDITMVRHALTGQLRDLRVRPDRDAIGVEVVTIDELRGRSFDAVYVPGLAEKIFPTRWVPHPLLGETLRLAWNEAEGLALQTRQQSLEIERDAFRVALGAAERSIWLSWPCLDVERGRPRMPSSYVLAAAKAVYGRYVDAEELQSVAGKDIAPLRWPAPSDPEAAIDAMERDLAVMRPALGRRGGTSSGTLAHLPQINSHLRRALRARIRRWDTPGKWTASDGLVGLGSEAAALLRAHHPDVRPYSATALQRVAACPYQFFLNQVLRLEPREVPEAIETMDPRQRGSLVHDIQFELLTLLRSEGLLPLDHPQKLEVARMRLHSLAKAVGERWAEELVPAIPRVWEDGLAAITTDLSEWLSRLHEQSPEWTPTHFELAFGLRHQGGRDDASQTDPVVLDEGIRLRGSIDMVEARGDEELRATDHKTGKASAKQSVVVGGGRTLQPALYALALEKLFEGSKVVEGRLWFCTSRGGFEERRVPLNDQARRAVSAVTDTLTGFIEKGFIPAHPFDASTCRWCDYATVCGPDEPTRVDAKTNERPMERLYSLRKLW